MDPQMLFNLAAGLVVAGIGWFARQIWDSVQKLQIDLHALEVDLPKTYVSKTEYGEDFKEIKADLTIKYDFALLNYSIITSSKIISENLSRHDNVSEEIFSPPPEIV